VVIVSCASCTGTNNNNYYSVWLLANNVLFYLGREEYCLTMHPFAIGNIGTLNYF
jgi:hypothetical protein